MRLTPIERAFYDSAVSKAEQKTGQADARWSRAKEGQAGAYTRWLLSIT